MTKTTIGARARRTRAAGAAGLALGLAAGLAGCGGGDAAAPGAAVGGLAAGPVARRQALAAAPAASAPVSDAAAAMLFNWAERTYPALFPPGATTEVILEPYMGHFSARRYASTGNYLGLVKGGTVYGYGPFTQGALMSLGSFERYLCAASPAECGPAPAQVLRVRLDAGTLQCETDPGISRLDGRRRLTSAGITVVGSDCGQFAGGIPAACGFTDGRYWLYDIDASQRDRAYALGYAPVGFEDHPAEPRPHGCTY